MPGFKDFVDGDELPESDLDDYLMKQTVMKFASTAARDAALTATYKREGMLVYRDDGNTLEVSRDATAGNYSTIGPVHGGLLSWSPTVTQSGTVAYTLNYGGYSRVGRRIHAEAILTVTGSGTSSNIITLTLPVAATAGLVSDYATVGWGFIADASTGLGYEGAAALSSTTTMKIRQTGSVPPLFHGNSGLLTAALAAGDIISVQVSYEAGSDA